MDDLEFQLAHEFPKLVGSHFVIRDVALEFIKHVCPIFVFDNCVQHNVLVCLVLLALSFLIISSISILYEFCATPSKRSCFLGLLT